MKNQSSYVEIKTVTWSKDSHGLFDYESKNVHFVKTKVETSSKVYKTGNDVTIKSIKESSGNNADSARLEEDYLFSVQTEVDKNGKYYIKAGNTQHFNNNSQNTPFLIVRSLKNDEGVQKGYDLELGDVIRLGRIEYRVLEFQDHMSQVHSVFQDEIPHDPLPFKLNIKECKSKSTEKRQCRICLMDEHESSEILVNPCSCKGSTESVHIKCLQDWISSKTKRKTNPSTTCIYWKKLNCEICKASLPDLVDVQDKKLEVVPIQRTETPYILLERVFYDKTKESSSNSKTLILLSVSNEAGQIKLGRGHECDLRENDISVSRLHAFIQYSNTTGNFRVIDNNSKFGTLILLRRDYEIERKKIALQTGRTVLTFSLKHSTSNNTPVGKEQLLLNKSKKSHSPDDAESDFSKAPPVPCRTFKVSDFANF